MPPPYQIVILLGSMREQSYTSKAVALAVQELLATGQVKVDVIDPRQLDLRLPGSPGSDEVYAATSTALQARARQADGVLMVTPEYDGSYSAVTKLLIEHLGYPSVLAGKPIGLLGVASGQIGALRAIDHLRSVCGHIGGIVLPASKSVAAVHRGFDRDGRVTDSAMETTIRSAARELVEFLARLSP